MQLLLLEGATQAEIAEELRVTKKVAGERLRNGTLKLQKQLEENPTLL